MRVTAWNRPRADVEESLGMLARMSPDLVALQECRLPAGSSDSVVWRGDYPPQGSAVVSTSAALPIEPIEIPCLHPTVVPVVVQAPEPFMFAGVWTHPDYNRVAWEAMSACAAAADGMPLVAAGDFNSSPRVQGQERQSEQFLDRMRDELGLVSAYHHFTGEAFGEETRATHYWLRKESNPFYLDYCFLPIEWASRVTGVSVGSFADWRQSDHRPVTVEFDI